MRWQDVRQLQTLNAIMAEQMAQYPFDTVAIWGIAGGNGLEHAVNGGFQTIYGIDVNKRYLNECRHRYQNLSDRLILMNLDLSAAGTKPPGASLVIANLLVEYIGVECFARQLQNAMPRVVSCVIQQNDDAMKKIGLKHLVTKAYPLPNKKRLVRLDYSSG